MCGGDGSDGGAPQLAYPHLFKRKREGEKGEVRACKVSRESTSKR